MYKFIIIIIIHIVLVSLLLCFQVFAEDTEQIAEYYAPTHNHVEAKCLPLIREQD